METIEIKDAKKFLNELSLESSRFDSIIEQYIFRGQFDANWEIIPSALRKNPKLFNEARYISTFENRTNREQIEVEFYTLKAFIEELNKNGYHIPNEELLNLDSYGIGYIEFITRIGRGEIIWPTKEYHSIIAIAQHNGIPTRFTDWTYDPMVAAYFAAKDILQNKKSDYIAVYALNLRNSDVRNFGFHKEPKNEERHRSFDKNKIYQIVQAPSVFNVNLKAQRALFLSYVEKSYHPNDRCQPYSLEKYLEDKNREKDSYKFIIASEKAEHILHLLNKRFYNASVLFPSIEGCVAAIYETRPYLAFE